MKTQRMHAVVLTTIFLVIFFMVYTYLDRGQMYDRLGAIIILTNTLAYVLPQFIQRPHSLNNSFLRIFLDILVSSLICIPIFIGFVIVFNVFTVPNFTENISLLQFIVFTGSIQVGYALLASSLAAIILKMFFRPDSPTN
jgi:hypothetical protein